MTEGFEALCHKEIEIRFVDGADSIRSITSTELRTRALGLLHHFREHGIRQGDELIICTSNNLAFIDAFWACLFGGVIPVPVAPGISEEQRTKLFRVYGRLRRPFLYTDHQTGARIRALADQLGIDETYQRLKAKTVLTENITDLSQAADPVRPSPNDTAFIQFSSGSTRDPKGVVLSHHNLTINIRDIHAATRLSDDDSSLSWMPLTHDMGLIGFHLAMLMRGLTHTIMATDVFVRRPTLWLQTACRDKVTLLCSPNFGYRLFLKAFGRWKIADLDLSHIRLIFNGAEPISAAVCTEFLDTLAPYGLKRAAMVPVYGLAEAGLAVSFSNLDKNYNTMRVKRNNLGPGQTIVESADDKAIEIVEAGVPVAHCNVRITDGKGMALSPRRVGSIEISGPNVTKGYYGEVSPQPDNSHGRWFDTGDLGFVKDDSLYVTGRLKDILFVNGQNYYAQDLENIACSVDGIDAGKIAVCAVSHAGGKSEAIAAFVLHFGSGAEFVPVALKVQEALSKHAGVELNAIIPVDEIPKTTSGKIRRYALRQAYDNGEFESILADHFADERAVHPESASHSELEETLFEICANSLDGVKLHRHDNFFEIGLNSLKLVEIHELIDQHFPSQLEISDIFDHPTLAQLAAFLQINQQSTHSRG